MNEKYGTLILTATRYLKFEVEHPSIYRYTLTHTLTHTVRYHYVKSSIILFVLRKEKGGTAHANKFLGFFIHAMQGINSS